METMPFSLMWVDLKISFSCPARAVVAMALHPQLKSRK